MYKVAYLEGKRCGKQFRKQSVIFCEGQKAGFRDSWGSVSGEHHPLCSFSSKSEKRSIGIMP